MASTINAISTGAGGLVSAGDASGQLQLQTNSTTALTIDASQNATFVGTVAATSYTGSGANLTGVGAMTLLGTINTSSNNSLSLGSLTLTSYKSLFIVINAMGTNGDICYISSSNIQTGGNIIFGVANTAISSNFWLDLTSGTLGGGAAASGGISASGTKSNVSTSSTTIYFRLSSTSIFNQAGGTILIYGVK